MEAGKIEKPFKDLVLTRLGSRLIQTCLKHGNRAQKEKIYSKVMESSPLVIFTNEYGHFILKKLMLYVVDKTMIGALVKIIKDNFSDLMNNPNSCKSLHDFFETFNEIKCLTMLEELFDNGNEQTEAEVSKFVAYILENNLVYNSAILYWFYHNWERMQVEEISKLYEMYSTQLDKILESTKITGV